MLYFLKYNVYLAVHLFIRILFNRLLSHCWASQLTCTHCPGDPFLLQIDSRQDLPDSFLFLCAAYFGSFHSLSYHHQNAKTRPRKPAVRALPHFCQLTKLLYRSPLHSLPQWRWFYRLCVYLDFKFLLFFKKQKKIQNRLTTGSRVWFGRMPRGGVARTRVKTRKKERTRGHTKCASSHRYMHIQNVHHCIDIRTYKMCIIVLLLLLSLYM